MAHTGLTQAQLQGFSNRFDANPMSRMRQNAVGKVGVNEAAVSYDRNRRMRYQFSVELTAGKVTAQKGSGRCWIFAALNTMRQAIMEKLNLETLELSQNYTFFYDQLEKSHYFLCAMIETAGESLESRIVHHLLHNPLADGGQWDMLRNVVEKYGVVPKDAMPESFHSSNTRRMNKFVTLKLREGAARIREAFAAGKGAADLAAIKDKAMEQIYGILCVTLGKPPERFTFECRDQDKKFICDPDITPKAFFEKYVGWRFDDFISLINAPTADKPYGKTYTVRYLGNVVEGRPIRYLNVPSDVLKRAAIAQMQAGRPVWFGCDVGQWLADKDGIMDTAAYDFDAALGCPFPLTKAERLDLGDSLMTHAMVFQGVELVDGKPVRWKVENSWDKEAGNEGWYIMSDEWFDEYLYQVVVDKQFVPAEWIQAFEQEPIALEPWDPMGALAK